MFCSDVSAAAPSIVSCPAPGVADSASRGKALAARGSAPHRRGRGFHGGSGPPFRQRGGSVQGWRGMRANGSHNRGRGLCQRGAGSAPRFPRSHGRGLHSTYMAPSFLEAARPLLANLEGNAPGAVGGFPTPLSGVSLTAAGFVAPMRPPVAGTTGLNTAHWSRAEARGHLLAGPPPRLDPTVSLRQPLLQHVLESIGRAGSGVELSARHTAAPPPALADIHRQLPPPPPANERPLTSVPPPCQLDPVLQLCNEFILNNQRSLYSSGQHAQRPHEQQSRRPRSRSPAAQRAFPAPTDYDRRYRYSPPRNQTPLGVRKLSPKERLAEERRHGCGSSARDHRPRSQEVLYARQRRPALLGDEGQEDRSRARSRYHDQRSDDRPRFMLDRNPQQQQQHEDEESEEMLRYRLEYEAQQRVRKKKMEAVQKVKEMKRKLRVAEADARMLVCGGSDDRRTGSVVAPRLANEEFDRPCIAANPVRQTTSSVPDSRPRDPPLPAAAVSHSVTRKKLYRIRKDERGQPIQKFELDPVTREVIREVPLVQPPLHTNFQPPNNAVKRRVVISSVTK